MGGQLGISASSKCSDINVNDLNIADVLSGEENCCNSNALNSSLATDKSSDCLSSPYDSKLIINSPEYNIVVRRLREFFYSKNFIEVSTQNRLSILAACEDPFNVETFVYNGVNWPLPQTGQMWLEYELLKHGTDKDVQGYFCLTTSYRNEKNPVEGRHDLIFPLFEFEMKGDIHDLMDLEKELLIHLGYSQYNIKHENYNKLAKHFQVEELDHDHELALGEKSPTFFIMRFPELTHPFWNMKRVGGGLANKVDVILSGYETIGSAERECDPEKMRDCFNTIMDGKYRDKLYELFGKERTDKELEEYLKFDFFKRVGGGIGVTRLIRSMKAEKLI